MAFIIRKYKTKIGSRRKMKDKKWKDMIEKHGELRFFSSMAIKK